MAWTPDGPQGNEAAKVRYDIVPYTRGRGLDLGCGPAKAYPHFIGLDNNADAALFGIHAKPDILVETCEVLDFKDATMDFVFSSHLLEHIENYKAALAEWWRVIKVGGHLVLYLPDEDQYPKVGEKHANPDHKWNVSYDRVIDAMPDGWDLIRFEKRSEGNEYSLLFVFAKLGAGRAFSWTEPKPAKSVCVVRYGGFGDQLQAAAILPELKRQGYHVTMMTTPKGKDIIEQDPHVDAWVIQDNDQVPNHELGMYWDVWRKRFDRWINLSESVERTLLAMPGTTQHQWSHTMRDRRLNDNYGEFVANIADLPFKPEGRFYATEAEKAWAKDLLCESPGFTILWTLAGSSIHKFTPHMDTIIARLMLAAPDIHVIFAGDEACQILEIGWEKEPRVHRHSGKMKIRETLALAMAVDCVVGPETGVLNAVAYEPMPKIVFLSHSSKNNLTKNWKQTVALTPVAGSTPCYPCHRLHYTSQFCHTDPDVGAALCQMNTSPEEAFRAIFNAYGRWNAAKARPAILNRMLKVVSR
jgi:ADP-heptose:LPS heptosyltransferase/predicted SAM-dependent methyltransferase